VLRLQRRAGSASIWLHLGALGSKRVVVPDDGSMPAAPYGVEDNPHSWLAHFDLVFIDPPHTGWSVASSEEARKKLLSVDGDVTALADVIRTWLTRHRRWGSPIYLAGESYGTTRGAALADKLLSAGVALSGLILVSCAMDLQSIVFAPTNDLPYALFLPAFRQRLAVPRAAEGELAGSAQAARNAAEAFVDEEYASALLAGARLGEKRRSRIARRIAELTGLPQALVEEKNLRISDQTYFFEALRSQGRIVGRLEARSTGRWRRAGRASGSSTPASRLSPRHTRWPPWPTLASSSAWPPRLATRCSRTTRTRPGTGTAARTRATASPARAATWHGRCAATRT
jgi:carboxypeptidase C (cathepsin A)